jgi:hypothetical protein
MLPPDRHRTAANVLGAWLATGLVAGLAGVLLLLAAHGAVVSFLGAAGSLDLIGAVAAVEYGFRRAAHTRNPAAVSGTGQPHLPAALLGVTVVITATALLAAIGALTTR